MEYVCTETVQVIGIMTHKQKLQSNEPLGSKDGQGTLNYSTNKKN